MVASAVQVAKRTLLATMRAVALSFGMVLTRNRDSSDKDVVVRKKQLSLARGRCLGDSASPLRKFMPFQNTTKDAPKIYKIHVHGCIVYMLCDALVVCLVLVESMFRI